MGRLARQRIAKAGRTKQPLQTFFSSFSDFDFDQDAPSGIQFQLLRKKQGWKRGDAVGEVAWQDFRSALVLEFNARFGTQANDLLAWQTLCRIVGIEEADVMDNWEACEKASDGYCFEQPYTGKQYFTNTSLLAFEKPILQSRRCH
jgi:hypothetical protein